MQRTLGYVRGLQTVVLKVVFKKLLLEMKLKGLTEENRTIDGEKCHIAEPEGGNISYLVIIFLLDCFMLQ